MTDHANKHFGILIAYITPGFLALCGLAFVLPEVRQWLTGASQDGPTLGGFLYVTVASIAGGMIANAVRWAILDTVHHATGLTRPDWNDGLLHKRLTAYEWLIENHYRHYQFYGNTIFSVLFTYMCWRSSLPASTTGPGWVDGAVVALSVILAAGSRTTLARYYRRTQSLLGTIQGEVAMANGGHPNKPATKPGTNDPKTGSKPTK